MTTLEAIGLQTVCEKMFSNIAERPEISMALTGRLKISFDDNFITFDHCTGAADYICYTGSACDLDSSLAEIKRVVLDGDNQKKLALLKWSYEHRTELEP